MMLIGPCLAAALALAGGAPAAAPAAPAAAQAARATPAFEVDTEAGANALYHVACLAETLPCTRAAFESLWQGELRWSKDDAARLEVWKAIFARVAAAQPPPAETPFVGNTLSLRPALAAERRVLAALLDARSTADLQRRTSLDRADAARLRDIADHFRRRLRPWWTARARRTERSRVEAWADGARALVRGPGLTSLIRTIAAFVEPSARAQTADLRAHLILSPAPQADAASATVIDTHLVIEVTGSASARSLAEVIVHETTHFLYDSAPPERLIALMEQFARLGTPQAAAFYTLENEAIATTAQLMAGERLEGAAAMAARADRDTYRHDQIPRAARGARRALQAALDASAAAGPRTTLYQGFTEPYIREVTREFGVDVERPAFLLTTLALLPTERAGRATAVFQQAIRPITVAGTEEWQRFSQQPLVFLIGHDQLREAFGTQYPEVPEMARTRGFAYRALRGNGASLYILSGKDEQSLIDVVQAFARQAALAPSGLLVTVD